MSVTHCLFLEATLVEILEAALVAGEKAAMTTSLAELALFLDITH
jgi:hypothetical protein